MAPLPTATVHEETYHASNALRLIARGSTQYAKTVLDIPSRIHLAPRQAQTSLIPVNGVVAIPATYNDLNGPPAGQVVGIVLGSVFGFILLIWLIYSILGPKDPVIADDSTVTDLPPPRERRKSRHRHRSRSVRSRSRSPSIDVRERTVREVREVHTDGPRIVPMPMPMAPPMYVPPPREPMVERVVVEERRERPRSRSRMTRGTATDSGADEVVVIEEHSPSPKRDRSRRRSRRGSGAYRPVDPDQWGGGDAPPRRVSRR